MTGLVLQDLTVTSGDRLLVSGWVTAMVTSRPFSPSTARQYSPTERSTIFIISAPPASPQPGW